MRALGVAVGEAVRRRAQLRIRRGRDASAQAAMKAAAVERLTPAKQWITIGSARSHASTKASRRLEMRRVRQDLARHRLDDVGKRQVKVALRRDRDWALDRRFRDSTSVTSDRAPVAVTVVPTSASEQTWSRGMAAPLGGMPAL